MKTKGFTLIELVIVVVILGILAVTALPRFIDLQTDARISALQGLLGAMQGANDQLIGVSSVQGLDTVASSSVIVEGETVAIAFGYARADNANAWSRILEANIEDSTWGNDNADWYFNNDDAGDSIITFMPRSRRNQGDSCFLTYNEATSASAPSYILTTDGC